jgi:lauroyl/myristoyl acyltransferase
MSIIKSAGRINCVDLSDKFGKGDYTLTIDGHTVVLFGMTSEMLDVVESLMRQKKIALAPANTIEYITYGTHYDLPVFDTEMYLLMDTKKTTGFQLFSRLIVL